MNRSHLAIAAAFSLAAFAAQAESPDPSGQFAKSVKPATAVEAQADAGHKRVAGQNPWSTQYNPLKSFQSQRTRADVQAEYIASRDRVEAFTGEDSGSAFLASNRPVNGSSVVAGQPVNAQ